MKKVTSKFPGKRILVADDYFINQEVAQEILELMDIEVEIAINGIQAIEKHKTKHFDIILMDVQMPKMDGYDATKLIRSQEEEGKHIPIIALTASALSGDREKCLNAGMDDYLSKPIEAEKLEEIVQQYLPD